MRTIIDKIDAPNYSRKPEKELLYLTKYETKTILIARYGMLECGINFKGTQKPNCDLCHDVDDENHCLNFCSKWQSTNLYHTSEKTPFENVYSNDQNILRDVIKKIDSVWNTTNAHGTMRMN